MMASQAQSRGVSTQIIEDETAARNSIRHIVDAAEVASVVTFLCSPRSIAINGDAIAVGGGTPRSIHY
jgi:enoyl-[acyl-carrier-protein] reductase (NADH)